MWLTNTLDNQNSYDKDHSNLYGSVVALPEQIRKTWEEMQELKLPKSYKQVNKVVLVGMGGSALGARVAATLLERKLEVPFTIINDYHLPYFVDDKTLVILSSYSGNTEEILSAAKETEKYGARVVVIAAGGKLKEWAEKRKLPFYSMSKLVNPSNQPRMAIGHSVMGVLGILAKAELTKISKKKLMEVLVNLEANIGKWQKEKESKDNAAKKMALKLKDKGIILIAARHLRGAVHVFKNQLNENAKVFAAGFDLPELGHHLIEGLVKPQGLKNDLIFVLFDSVLYEAPIRKRLEVTEEIIKKQGYEAIKVMADGEDELNQMWEVILFGEFVSLYLAILTNLDPSPIPMVDYLKKRME